MEHLMNALIHRRWLMMTLFILLAGIGIYAWKQLAIDAYPDIAEVTVGVVTQVPGLAAEEIEQQITIPIERELNGMPRMKMMRSKNTFGLSTILLVFDDGTDDYWARQRVQERINNVDLPFDAKPELNPLTSPIGEIYRYVVTGNKDLRELTELNRWVIIPRLRQIQGVADVAGFGGLTTQFQIEIDPNKLTKYNLSLGEITESIERNNSNAGGSMLTRGDLSYVVRGVGLVSDLQDLGNIVVKTVGGAPVYIKDLGELKYGNLERKGILGYTDNKFDYEDGVEGIVQMLRYENPSWVLEKIHQTIDELNNDVLPKGVKIHTFYDRTHLVDNTLHTISHTLFYGFLLVIIVLIIFLGSPKGALLATITIPISLLIAFLLMWLTNIPANLLSLGAIDFGIIVEGSIVMMETVLKKREDNPHEPLDEINIAKRVAEVAKPIFFATLIIIVAYLPLFAFGSVEKKLFTPMAFTLSFALLGALAVALILIPGLAFAIYRKPQKIYHNRWLERLTEKYKRTIEKNINTPKKIIAPIIVILVAVIGLSVYVGKDFLPYLDEGSIWIQVQMPPGISLEKAKEMSTKLRNKLKEFPEVTYVMTQTGRDDEGVDPFPFSHIETSVGLKPYHTWKKGRKKSDLITDMAAMVETMPGDDVGFSQPIIDMVMDQIAGSHSDLAIKINGEDLEETRRIAEKILAIIKNIHGATDIAIDQDPSLPQLQIIANREKIAQYGINVADVAELIEVAIGGKAISQVFIGAKVYDVICRYNDASRDTPEKIGALMLTSEAGALIPLSAVADIKTTTGASTITCEMNRRFTTVRVNLRNRDLSSFYKEAQSLIAQQVQYDHTKFQIRWSGQLENQQRAYSRLAVVVPLTLAVMFLLLFFAFGKFRQAGLLIGMLPLTIFGGMLALVVRGMTFNVSSAVGFIALFGLSILNGVIMTSRINALRAKGTELWDAVVNGSSQILRPVIMTATVAILGLLPASLATNIGSDVQRPLATVIVYGLLVGTFITLFALPVFYYLMEAREMKKIMNYELKMNKIVSVIFLAIAIMVPQEIANAQNYEPITFTQYLNLVGQNNLGFIAEKFNVKIAEANVVSQKVFPDPELTVSAFDNDERNLQLGRGLGFDLDYNLELGGKRNSRIRLAKSEAEMAKILLEGSFRELRADAAILFLESLKQKGMLEVKQESYNAMKQLYEYDSLRYKLGEINEIDMRQTKLEAAALLNDVYSQEADYKSSMAELCELAGRVPNILLMPQGEFVETWRATSIQELRIVALNNRIDLTMALKQKEISANQLKLTKAERAIDLGVNIGYDFNTEARNEIAPVPAFRAIRAGVTVPLRFSNINRGTIKSSQYAVEQSEIEYAAIELQIQRDITQAFFNYEGIQKRLSQYKLTILNDAKKVYDGILFKYRSGETNLLEVLVAQRTYNEIRESYVETLFDYASSIIEINKMSGIWEVEF